METWQITMYAVAGVFLVLYLTRRANRLRADE